MPQEEASPRRRSRLMIGLVILLALAAVNLAILAGKVQFEKVVSASMEPTLQVGDVIFSDADGSRDRYEVVCLMNPQVPDEKLVKRIIGLPGDVIRIEDGILYLNGREEYSANITDNKISWPNTKIKVPEDTVFVLGDNRNNTCDSLDFGPVPYDNIRGVVRGIVWPAGRWGRLPSLH
jgi:signal peptidase I